MLISTFDQNLLWCNIPSLPHTFSQEARRHSNQGDLLCVLPDLYRILSPNRKVKAIEYLMHLNIWRYLNTDCLIMSKETTKENLSKSKLRRKEKSDMVKRCCCYKWLPQPKFWYVKGVIREEYMYDGNKEVKRAKSSFSIMGNQLKGWN